MSLLCRLLLGSAAICFCVVPLLARDDSLHRVRNGGHFCQCSRGADANFKSLADNMTHRNAMLALFLCFC